VTYVDVIWVRGSRPVELPTEIEESVAEEPAGQELTKSAEGHAKRVAVAAREVVDQAAGIYRALGKSDFTVDDLRRSETDASLRQFERGFAEFHGTVKNALDEYLHGNTLVMDLILKYQLDRETVRHALSVAAFATEMATQLALGQGDDSQMRSYYGAAPEDEIRNELGLSHEEADELCATDPGALRMALFREELVEIFLGGFMHDCGLWMEPFLLPEGHEVKGAKLISETKQVQRFAPALAKIVLFHSDVVRLARKHGLVRITESPEDPTRMNFRREFYDERDDLRSRRTLLGECPCRRAQRGGPAQGAPRGAGGVLHQPYTRHLQQARGGSHQRVGPPCARRLVPALHGGPVQFARGGGGTPSRPGEPGGTPVGDGGEPQGFAPTRASGCGRL